MLNRVLPSTSFQKFLAIILLSLSLHPAAYSQKNAEASEEAELYRNVVRAIGKKNYSEAIELGRELIERTDKFEQVYARIIEAAKSAGQLEQARSVFESLLQKSPSNPRGYYGLGLIYSEQKNYTGAIEYYKKCINAEPDFPPPFLAIISAYKSNKKLDEAEAFIKSMIQANPNSSLPHLGLSQLYVTTKQTELAIQEINTSLFLNPKLLDACFYKSLLLYQTRRRHEALIAMTQCLVANDLETNEEYQQTFSNLTIALHIELMNYFEAIKTIHKSLNLSLKMGDRKSYAVNIGYLALVNELQGYFSKALIGWQQANDLSTEINDVVNLRRYPWRIGNIYFLLGDLPEARQQFEAGLQLSLEADDKEMQAIYLSRIGDVFAAQNQSDQAIAYYKKLEQIEGIAKTPALQLFLLDLTYPFYLKTGQYQKAQEAIEQALLQAEQLSDAERKLRALNSAGELYLRLNTPMKAVSQYKEALQFAKDRNSPLHAWTASAGMAAAYRQMNQPAQAREFYLEAIEIMEDVRSRLTAEEEKVGFFQDKVKIYKDLIATLIELHGKEPAKSYDAEAFDYAERARGRAFLDLLAEAKVNLDQSLEPALLEKRQIIQNEVSRINSELVAERSKESSKQDSVTLPRLEKALRDANEQLDNWVREVKLSDPRYAALKFPEPIKLPEAQKLLNEQSAMLAYSLGEKESFLFAVTHDSYKVFNLKSSADIRQQVEILLGAINGKWHSNSFKNSARELYQSLIEPAKELLAGKKDLIVVADESLHRLPFEALLAAQPEGNSAQWHYLVKDFAVSYAPSVSVLAFLKTRPQLAAPKDFVAFGDPIFGKDDQMNGQAKMLASANKNHRGLSAKPERVGFWRKLFGSFTGGTRGASNEQLQFKRLPFSRSEAMEIASLFPAGKADLFLDKNATEENAKTKDLLGQYGIVHFSTHGLPNEDRPRFSSLILSSPVKGQSNSETIEDGWLSAYEIFNLKLKANLVVLSACETGLGKEVKGEGLMSLTRAFIYAGAPSVVVSLWKVNDAASKDLMVAFYRHLRGDEKISYSEALRRAQLEMIGKGNAPKFWAPFVLVGKP